MAHRVNTTTLKRYRELLELHVVAIGPFVCSGRTAVNAYRVLPEMLGEAMRWRDRDEPSHPYPAPRTPRPAFHVPDAQACAGLLERARGHDIERPVVIALGTRDAARGDLGR